MSTYDINVSNHQERKRADTAEYRAYVALLFVLALPFGLVFWAATAVLGIKENRNPVTRARLEAHRIAALIFAA